ncbi:MAG: S8 family serine peptidase, partial [Coriobacteriales bacterium]|nr:S8 family serine peptidase [Coriobacteriales bacterium]
MLHFMKKISSTVSASLLALLLVFGLLPVGLAWGDEPSAPGASTAQSAEGADTTQTNSADADATGGAAGAHGASADGSTDGTNGADDAPAPDSASESLLVWAALDDDTVFSTLTQAEDAGVIVAPSNDFASYVADEIIVVYAEEEALVKEIAAVEEELANLSETDGVPTTEVLAADFEGQPLATVMLPEDVSVEDALLVAANSDSVVFAQPNFLYLPLAAPAPHIPNDPMTKSSSYNYQWAHDAVNDFQAWGFIDQKYSSSPRPVVSIGVLDTGMRLDHEDLVNATATGASGTLAWDAGRQQSLEVTANDPSITTDWYGDFNGHGTHVAGIAAAVADNNKGGAGSSYNSKVIPISLVDPDTGGLDTATIVVGINYLLGLPSSANVRVINMSLGGVEEDPFFHAAVIRANNAGILCVVAAGNINLSQGFTPGVTIYPASWPEVISVANLQQNSTRSSTSEYHATLDIAAPGTSLWSSYLSSSTSYVSMDGTSMASPLVAGIAALLFTYDPDITTAQAKQVLYDSARDRMSSDAADALGWDPYYGWGAIDAAGALA